MGCFLLVADLSACTDVPTHYMQMHRFNASVVFVNIKAALAGWTWAR
jgi:hypothetical protein